MARGTGFEYHFLLDKTIEKNEGKGVYVRDLRKLFEHGVSKEQLDIPIANSMFTPLTEMYLVSNNINHIIRKNREGIFFSCVAFKSDVVRQLMKILNTSITTSEAARSTAHQFYLEIFKTM